MKYLLLTFLLIFSSNIFAVDDSTAVEEIRLKFYEAVEHEDAVDELENLIKEKYRSDYKNFPPLILAYYGGVETLRAKHAFNPINKLSYLLDGLELLESAVNKQPDNLEIRFMRFSILHYVPGIIGFGDERESDKNAIVNLLLNKKSSGLPDEIQSGIVNFMLQSERLSGNQERQLRKMYSPVSLK